MSNREGTVPPLPSSLSLQHPAWEGGGEDPTADSSSPGAVGGAELRLGVGLEDMNAELMGSWGQNEFVGRGLADVGVRPPATGPETTLINLGE